MKMRQKSSFKWKTFDALKHLKGRRLDKCVIPPLAGVYKIIRKNTSKTKKNIFYVGETKNLQQRISSIFNCAKDNTCCKSYKKAYKTRFFKKDRVRKLFIAKYKVTKGMRGRIEIEEALQKKHGTNKAEFYINWEP